MSRYRETMAEAMNKVLMSEKEISKLRNGVKVLGNALPNRALAQKMADKANKEMGHDADVYQSPFNNRFYVRIKEETLNEKDHEVSMARGELEAISDKALKLSSILQGKSDEGNPLEAWVQSKITKAKDYINSVADYMEYNPDNAMEGKVECPKCEGKGCEHCDNKGYHMTEGTMIGGIIKHPGQPSAEYGRAKTLYRTFMSKPQPAKGAEDKVLKFVFDDQLLDDLYSASQKTPTKDVRPMVKNRLKQLGINEENLEESFNDAQIAKLKKEYEPLRGKKISIDNANKLGAMFTKFDKDKNALEKLYGGNIPFISTMAMTRLMTKHNYKAADLNKIRKEDIDYNELEILDEATQTLLDITEGKIDAKKFDSLKKGDTMTITYNSVMSGTTVKKFVVKSKSRSAKYNTDKVTMYPEGNPNMARFFLYKRANGDVSLATGDMAASIVSVKEETILEFTTQQIKMAYGVANDKRYKAGNYSGAVAAIEKIAKGLSKHPDVAKVLKRVNEEKEYTDAEIGEMFGNKQIDPTTAAALRAYLSGRAGGSPFPPVVEGMMSKIDQMQKDGKSVADIAKELKMDVKVVKGILGEEVKDKDSAYAIGMAQAKKMTGDEKPLKKSTITKGHEIAKSILKKEEKEHPGKMKYEEIAGLKKKAEKSGMPYGILKKVYDRGMAAWRGGHRPGASQQQWAFARVNSFVTKSSGTWGGADKDLAAKVKGSK